MSGGGVGPSPAAVKSRGRAVPWGGSLSLCPGAVRPFLRTLVGVC